MGFLVPKRPSLTAVQQLLEASDVAAARSAIGAASTAAVDAKADATAMTAALASKANAADVTTALAAKADAAATTAALNGKLTTPAGGVNGKVLGFASGAPAWVDAPAGGGTSGAGNTFTVVQSLSGQTWSWSATPAQVAAARTAGAIIQWMWRNADGAPYPQVADGMAAADLVNGTSPVTVSISANDSPVANDPAGTSGDAVVLTKVAGVAWVVDGVSHPSSGMAGATKTVPYTKGTATVVTATSEPGYYIDSASTQTFNLTFTNTYSGLYTSDDFARAQDPLVITTSSGLVTNAALGGNPVACVASQNIMTVTGGNLTFTGINGGLLIPLSAAPASAALEVVLSDIGSGTLIAPMRDASAGRVGVQIYNGQVFIFSTLTGATYTQSTQMPGISNGSTLRVEAWNGKTVDVATGTLTDTANTCAVKVYVNGAYVSGYTVAKAATPTEQYIGVANNGTTALTVGQFLTQVPAA